MKLIVVAHNIRSLHNVGSIFRTADGFGIEKLYLSGYTPHPEVSGDIRPPHVRKKLTQTIHKTALGAELTVLFDYVEDCEQLLRQLAADGYAIAGLEQAPDSIYLPDYRAPDKLVLVLGEEVAGVPETLLRLCDVKLEIPMHGQKESFNVSVATGIALYALTTGAKN